MGGTYEYKRHGTLSLLAGLDLLTGKVHACIEERHRSLEFTKLLEQIHQAYSAETRILIVLDNHSAHISKETQAYLKTQLSPVGLMDLLFEQLGEFQTAMALFDEAWTFPVSRSRPAQEAQGAVPLVFVVTPLLGCFPGTGRKVRCHFANGLDPPLAFELRGRHACPGI